MAKNSFTVRVRIDGVRETLAAFRGLPAEASDQLRDRSVKIAESLAVAAASAARSDRSPQSKLVARTVKAKRDRVPVIQVGGSTRLGRNRAPAWTLLFGSEFGSNSYRQFRKRHQGKQGSWFFPVVEDRQSEVAAEWEKATDEIIAAFTQGGGG